MQELARGERTASALEELLAQAEKAEKDITTTDASTTEKPASSDQDKSS
jgi:exonuclease VII small subunit